MSDDVTAAMLSAHDAALRVPAPETLPPGVVVEWDGPVARVVGWGVGFVSLDAHAALRGAQLDELIERQRAYFAERREAVEWKVWSHDRQSDLPERLVAAGYKPEPAETVMVGSAASLAVRVELPPGVRIVEIVDAAGIERVVELECEVWHSDEHYLARDLAAELAASPQSLSIFAVEAGQRVLSAGWVRFVAGNVFAGLWGGSTHPRWRGRGLYRALVAHRAQLATARGVPYLHVDASDNSRPTLERLGLVAVTTTTPYVWRPPLDGHGG